MRGMSVELRGRAAAACAVAGVLMALGSVWAAQASAHLYWTNDYSPAAIGRANLNGAEANLSFITGASEPYGVAVDSGHVYWVNFASGSIGRANVNGTEVNQSFITGASYPVGVAADGGHVYWTNNGTQSIGRANVNGTEVNPSFITGAGYAHGVAVDGGHVYWVNNVNSIGRANLAGTEVNQSFITGASYPAGVAVDGGHVYWTNNGTDTIGRANVNGSEVNQGFITGANDPYGVAVDGGHVYWANWVLGTIGRANLDGTEVNQSFITVTGAHSLSGVAVDAEPPTALISAPVSGHTYTPGKVVKTKFSCMEGAEGTGIESCTDSHGGSGTKGTLDTSTVGFHTYTVTAKSKDGQTATASISYIVAPKGVTGYDFCGEGECGSALLLNTAAKTWEVPEYGFYGVIEKVKVGTVKYTDLRMTSEFELEHCVFVAVTTTGGFNSKAAPGNWECPGYGLLGAWYALKF